MEKCPFGLSGLKSDLILRTFGRPGLGRSVIWEKILPNSSEDEFLSFCVKPSPGPCGLSRLSYLSSLSSFGKGFTLSKPLSPGPPTAFQLLRTTTTTTTITTITATMATITATITATSNARHLQRVFGVLVLFVCVCCLRSIRSSTHLYHTCDGSSTILTPTSETRCTKCNEA